MPILKIFTCIQQHRIYQLSDTSLYQRLSRTFQDLCAPELGYGEKKNNNNNNKPILTQMLVGAHSDQGYLLGKKKKSLHPQMSCSLFHEFTHTGVSLLESSGGTWRTKSFVVAEICNI